MMTEEQWAELKPFAEAEAAARHAFTRAHAMNTQTDPRKRIEQAVWYARLRIEYQQAYLAAEAARKRILGA
jgi:hypothetical protein